jgi:hypothetical protein
MTSPAQAHKNEQGRPRRQVQQLVIQFNTYIWPSTDASLGLDGWGSKNEEGPEDKSNCWSVRFRARGESEERLGWNAARRSRGSGLMILGLEKWAFPSCVQAEDRWAFPVHFFYLPSVKSLAVVDAVFDAILAGHSTSTLEAGGSTLTPGLGSIISRSISMAAWKIECRRTSRDLEGRPKQGAGE